MSFWGTIFQAFGGDCECGPPYFSTDGKCPVCRRHFPQILTEETPVTNTPISRPITPEEARDQLLTAVANIAEYWGRAGATPLEAANGTAFSILAMLDGSNLSIPAMTLIPDPHPDDEKDAKENGGDYWTNEPINPDVSLHDLWHKYERPGKTETEPGPLVGLELSALGWRGIASAPTGVPILARYRPWKNPANPWAEQVVWFYDDEWREFPRTTGQAYAEMWKPLPTAVHPVAVVGERGPEHIPPAEALNAGLNAGLQGPTGYDYDQLAADQEQLRREDPHGNSTNSRLEWLAKRAQLCEIAEGVEGPVGFVLRELLEAVK